MYVEANYEAKDHSLRGIRLPYINLQMNEN
jgi:hypothetical protein